jgi:hypothetical protein
MRRLPAQPSYRSTGSRRPGAISSFSSLHQLNLTRSCRSRPALAHRLRSASGSLLINAADELCGIIAVLAVTDLLAGAVVAH